MTQVILFIFGAIIGSFLNVVGLRYRARSLGGRSSCVVCAKQLTWWELVPILSFFLLRGKCSVCRAKISWQYPLVEIFSGLVFATLPIWSWPVFVIYIVILIYDFNHKIIPNELVYISIVLALLIRLFIVHYSLFDFLIGPVLFVLFGLGWLISRGRAMGLGDAKLSLSVGLLLGASVGISAIVLAFWLGTLVTLPLMLFSSKGLTMKSEIPFAPFIIIGAWVSLLFNLDLFHVLSFIT